MLEGSAGGGAGKWVEAGLIFRGLGGEEKSFGYQLFERGADGDRFATEGDRCSVGLVGFRFFQFGGDFCEAGFEGENSFFQVGDLGGVLFLELAFGLAGYGFGSFLLFAFARGGSFFGRGGGSRCGRLL